MEWWNIGMVILKGIYSFFALLVKRCFNENPLSHFPEPSISTFQYSPTKRDGRLNKVLRFANTITYSNNYNFCDCSLSTYSRVNKYVIEFMNRGTKFLFVLYLSITFSMQMIDVKIYIKSCLAMLSAIITSCEHYCFILTSIPIWNILKMNKMVSHYEL